MYYFLFPNNFILDYEDFIKTK